MKCESECVCIHGEWVCGSPELLDMEYLSCLCAKIENILTKKSNIRTIRDMKQPMPSVSQEQLNAGGRWSQQVYYKLFIFSQCC